jgi:hypothetical protein
VLPLKLITLTAGVDDFSASVEEGYPPEEMEWRIVEAASEKFPEHKQAFYFDSSDNPAVDLIMNGRIEHRMKFEVE